MSGKEQPPAYEPQAGEPQSYPPAQPGYPPAQPGYPPAQPGYPPAQPGYPPAQPGYPSAQPSYPPAQPGAQPPPPPGYQATTVVVAQHGVGAPLHGSTIRYQQYPACIVCQHCQATVTTSMEYETGLLTWLAIGGLCIFGCWLGCCLIPLCIDGCKDVIHRCPNCNNVVGKFRHIS